VVRGRVTGMVGGGITGAPDATDEQMQAAALADPAVQAHVAGKTVRKVIVARGRLVSVVVG
jgi:leucyl-tRNA synthetase